MTMLDLTMSPRNIARRFPTTEIQESAIKPELEITVTGDRWRRISNFHPHFSACLTRIATADTTDVARHCQTLIDYPKSRWRPPKPEMEIKI